MNANNDEGSNFQTQSFESLKYSIAENSNDILRDPDINVVNANFENLNTPYLLPGEIKNFFDTGSSSNYFSILHVNIRSMKKNFENIKSLLILLSVLYAFLRYVR